MGNRYVFAVRLAFGGEGETASGNQDARSRGFILVLISRNLSHIGAFLSDIQALETGSPKDYLLCGIIWVNPAMETDGLSNLPSMRLGNGGEGVNLNGSDPPGAISPEIVG